MRLRGGSIQSVAGDLLYLYQELASGQFHIHCGRCNWNRTFATIAGAENTTADHMRSAHRVRIVTQAKAEQLASRRAL